jgi:hypothetical protein
MGCSGGAVAGGVVVCGEDAEPTVDGGLVEDGCVAGVVALGALVAGTGRAVVGGAVLGVDVGDTVVGELVGATIGGAVDFVFDDEESAAVAAIAMTNARTAAVTRILRLRGHDLRQTRNSPTGKKTSSATTRNHIWSYHFSDVFTAALPAPHDFDRSYQSIKVAHHRGPRENGQTEPFAREGRRIRPAACRSSGLSRDRR